MAKRRWVKGTAQSTIYNSNWSKNFSKGGDASDFVGGVLNDGRVFAKRLLVPGHGRRTGFLAQSIRDSGVLKVGPYHARGFIYATAPYAKFVEKGTHGPIVSSSGGKLKVPIVKYGTKTRPRDFVNGQLGQHFLRIAMAQARVKARKDRHFFG